MVRNQFHRQVPPLIFYRLAPLSLSVPITVSVSLCVPLTLFVYLCVSQCLNYLSGHLFVHSPISMSSTLFLSPLSPSLSPFLSFVCFSLCMTIYRLSLRACLCLSVASFFSFPISITL